MKPNRLRFARAAALVLMLALGAAVQAQDYGSTIPPLKQLSTGVGDTVFVEKTHVVGSNQLIRYYNAVTKRYAFGTPSENYSFHTQGFQTQTIVGGVYGIPLPGTRAITRYEKGARTSTTFQTALSLSPAQASALVQQGYVNPIHIGYGFENQFMIFPGGFGFGLREGPLCTLEECPREYFFGDLIVPSTPRPAGHTTQWLSFDITGIRFFTSAMVDHFAVALRGCMDVPALTGCQSGPLFGSGLILGAFPDCPGINTAIESFKEGIVLPQTCSNAVFEDGKTYRVYLTQRDSGMAEYAIYYGSTLVAYNFANVAALPGFDPAWTGLWMTNARSGELSAYTALVSNISYGWIP